MKSSIWTKIKREHGLYRYEPSATYHARVRFRGKLHRKKLETGDLEIAKRKLRAFKDDLERTDATKGNMSFAAVLREYVGTLTGQDDALLGKYFNALSNGDEAALKLQAKTLMRDSATLRDKLAVVGKLVRTWFGIASLPLRIVKPSQVTKWLSRHYGHQSAAYYNSALSVLRAAFDMAVADRIITESPAKGLKYRKREKPIRLTPTFEQFKEIVADIRAQRFNREAEQSGEFVEFLGRAGLGQAEAASITRADVDLEAGRFIAYRHKTDTGFAVPVFPQLRPLIEKLCANKKPHERLFSMRNARKAMDNACKRLGFFRQLRDGRLVPQFTQRSLRRMFITRAIEKGVDVKVIAEWQGHKDGGKLILQTYSHVRPVHSQRMAQLMSDDQPGNVIPITAGAR
jgi:integrase